MEILNVDRIKKKHRLQIPTSKVSLKSCLWKVCTQWFFFSKIEF